MTDWSKFPYPSFCRQHQSVCLNPSNDNIVPLSKALKDSFGNCQRPVFSLGVSQHKCMNKQVCENVYSIGHRNFKRIKKNILVAQICVFSDA